MPELPEVETMRRGIAGVVGGRIERVERLRCPRKPISIGPSPPQFRRRATGARIERTDRVGKRVVLWLDTGDAIVFEPRMTGLVLVSDPSDPLYSRLRLSLSGAAAEQLLYWDRRGLGSVRLYSQGEFAERFGSAVLGPDALAMTSDLYRERLGQSRRPIKVALLDQKCVAGIGNLYASEILHLAGIAPTRPCVRMTRGQWKSLAGAALEVLHAAIEYEGSTLSDGTYTNAINGEGGYQNHHRVYDKAGERCRRCQRGTIRRVVQAQRSTFYCPTCQRG